MPEAAPTPGRGKPGGNERPAEPPSKVREPSPVRPPDEPTPRRAPDAPEAEVDEEDDEKDVLGG